mgnify:CR=1 FL=1
MKRERIQQIINVCYTFGGYKDGSPWKAVHRTYSHNDQTANLGDNMDYAGSYTSGGCNTTTYFLFSTPTDNAHSTSSTRTSAFHMYSEHLLNVSSAGSLCGVGVYASGGGWVVSAWVGSWCVTPLGGERGLILYC